MKNIIIIGSSKLPCPAVRGGAVPILIEHIISENQSRKSINLHIYSIFDEEAQNQSKKYDSIIFHWGKPPKMVLLADKIIRSLLNLFKITNKINSVGYIFQTLWNKKRIKMTLMRNNFDFVVFENSLPILSVMRSRRIRNKYKNKYAFHSHSLPKKFFGTEKVLANSYGIISVSSFLSKSYSQFYYPKGNSKSIVLKNCVDRTIFYPRDSKESIRNKLGISDNDFVVIFVGRITAGKGIEYIIKALNKLNDRDIKLIIVGSNFYREQNTNQYTRKVVKMAQSLQNDVVFTGYIDNSQLPLYYSAADVVVSPSVCNEAAGLMNIEAMACGKVIITTNDGGIPEYVNEKHAFIIDIADKDSISTNIARNILFLKTNPNKKKIMEYEAIKQSKLYGKDIYFKEFINIIKSI